MTGRPSARPPGSTPRPSALPRASAFDEVAAILHSVGNVLNSIGISVGLLKSDADRSALRLLEKLSGALERHAGDPAALAKFLSEDPAGKNFASSLQIVTKHLAQERAEQMAEYQIIVDSIRGVRELVEERQARARRPRRGEG